VRAESLKARVGREFKGASRPRAKGKRPRAKDLKDAQDVG